MTSKEYQTLLEQLKNRPSSAHLSIQEMRAGFAKFMSAFPPDPDIVFEPFSIGSIPACWVLAPHEYRNNLKNREFDKEAPQNFCLERATIAEGQGASENKNCEGKPTSSKTDSSSCFGISRKKVILFFHGGGFNAGSIEGHRDLMGRISRASGFAVLGIGYRLAPEHPFPAALEDALKGYQWLLQHSYSASDIFLVGSSAGGGLVFSLCLRLKEENIPQPAAIVGICPMVDFTLSSRSMQENKEKDWIKVERLEGSVRDYCRGADAKNPLISPLFGDLHGLPPVFIQVGSHEILRDEGIALAEKAKKSGVAVTLEDWPEMVHCWHILASKAPEGQKAIDHIGAFLKKIS